VESRPTPWILRHFPARSRRRWARSRRHQLNPGDLPQVPLQQGPGWRRGIPPSNWRRWDCPANPDRSRKFPGREQPNRSEVRLKIAELRRAEHWQRQGHRLPGKAVIQPKPPIKFGCDIEIARGMWPANWQAGFWEIHQTYTPLISIVLGLIGNTAPLDGTTTPQLAIISTRSAVAAPPNL
jgi:hypothetical protein